MRRILLSSVVFLGLCGSAWAAADPGIQITKPIYEWKTESESDKKAGTFNHCLVKNMYDNGTVVMLAENNDGVQRLALHFPQEKMKTGEHFDLTLQIDKRDLFPVEAIAVSPTVLTIGIPQVLPDQMRKGQAMYLRGPNDEVVYMLNGADGAVAALHDCIVTNKNLANGVANLDKPQDAIPSDLLDDKVAAALPEKKVELAELKTEPDVKAEEKAEPKEEPKAEEKPPEKAKPKDMRRVEEAFEPAEGEEKKAAPEPEEKAEEKKPAEAPKPTAVAGVPIRPEPPAPTVSDNIKSLAQKLEPEKKIDVDQPLLPDYLSATMNKVGFAPQTLVAKPDGSTKILDYAWLHENLFIGVKEQSHVADADLTHAATYYMKLMKQRCGGPFVAEAALPQRSAGIYWLVAEAACSSPRNGDTIAALLFVNDPKRLMIYLVEAPAHDGAKAIKGRDAIIGALTK